MSQPIKIAQTQSSSIYIELNMANRHGLIVGATGTGKSVTLQVLAERFANIGVPVFMPDIKGDLIGVSQPGALSSEMLRKLELREIEPPTPGATPTMLWDIFGTDGASIGTTTGNVGPLLLSQMLGLNDVQSTIMSACFKIAQDQNFKLKNLEDIKMMMGNLEREDERYINIIGRTPSSTMSAIRRCIFNFETHGGAALFEGSDFDIGNIFELDNQGRGIINLLAAEKIINYPKLYSIFMFWILRSIYERLPEQGGEAPPKLFFLFDEAHLLFRNASKLLIEQIEFIVRMARSRGVSVFFITQQPSDIPDNIVSQLGNKIFHSLRANSPRDVAVIKSIAKTLTSQSGPAFELVIPNLETGEALFCLLDSFGRPGPTEQGYVLLPSSRLGGLAESERAELIAKSIRKRPRSKKTLCKSNQDTFMPNNIAEPPAKESESIAAKPRHQALSVQVKHGFFQFLLEFGRLIFVGAMALIRFLTRYLDKSARSRRGRRGKRK